MATLHGGRVVLIQHGCEAAGLLDEALLLLGQIQVHLDLLQHRPGVCKRLLFPAQTQPALLTPLLQLLLLLLLLLLKVLVLALGSTVVRCSPPLGCRNHTGPRRLHLLLLLLLLLTHIVGIHLHGAHKLGGLFHQ